MASTYVEPHDKLWALCQAFIDRQNIYCAETIGQSDRVIQNAYDFIEEVCEIVGYKADDEDGE